MDSLIYQWIDALWLPVVFFGVRKHHRLISLGFVASCMFMMRLEIELFAEFGFSRGVFGLMDYSLFERGLVTYSAIYTFFLLMAHYSPGSKSAIFLAGSISIFFSALVISMIVMIL